MSRACLKIAFWKMCVTICGRFVPNERGVAGYVDRIWRKYHAKWGVQMAGMNFQTRSSTPSQKINTRVFRTEYYSKAGFFLCACLWYMINELLCWRLGHERTKDIRIHEGIIQGSE